MNLYLYIVSFFHDTICKSNNPTCQTPGEEAGMGCSDLRAVCCFTVQLVIYYFILI